MRSALLSIPDSGPNVPSRNLKRAMGENAMKLAKTLAVCAAGAAMLAVSGAANAEVKI